MPLTTDHRRPSQPPPSTTDDLQSILLLGLVAMLMGWVVVVWLSHPYEMSPHVPDDVPAVRP